MKTKAPKAVLDAPEDTSPIIRAYFEFAHLKQLYRQGWLHNGVPEDDCESVAEHSFSVAVVAMLVAEAHFPDLDLGKILRMSLIHDFGEVYAGDFTPKDRVSLEQKYQLEKASVSQIFNQIPNGSDYLCLWEEFENGSSPEATFVRQIDKLEMALQASIYEHQGFKGLQDFYQSAAMAISDPSLGEILAEIQLLR